MPKLTLQQWAEIEITRIDDFVNSIKKEIGTKDVRDVVSKRTRDEWDRLKDNYFSFK